MLGLASHCTLADSFRQLKKRCNRCDETRHARRDSGEYRCTVGDVVEVEDRRWFASCADARRTTFPQGPVQKENGTRQNLISVPVPIWRGGVAVRSETGITVF